MYLINMVILIKYIYYDTILSFKFHNPTGDKSSNSYYSLIFT